MLLISRHRFVELAQTLDERRAKVTQLAEGAKQSGCVFNFIEIDGTK